MKRNTNKQSNALKEILEKKQAGLRTSPLIALIKEDLLEAGVTSTETTNSNEKAIAKSNSQIIQFGCNVDSGKTNTPSDISASMNVLHQLIEVEIVKCAKQLEIDKDQLKAWLNLQLEVPAKTILHLLRTVQHLNLDPLAEEIGFVQYEDGQWQTFISIDGCAKLLNSHAQFNGLTFTQAHTLIDGVPEWIECSIYRKDRELPICVREYFCEVKGGSAIWQKMPNRMLRHRALLQCVRLAI
jgi:hypothetical protein